MYYNIDEIKQEIDNIAEDLDAIEDFSKIFARHKTALEDKKNVRAFVNNCLMLMGDCQNLYEEIEKIFGIDVYND